MLENISRRDARVLLSDFGGMKISLASPETIRKWSHGEVNQAETINYRSYKPESEGLFCERIFGPIRDWECSCGKYKRIRNKGIVCDRCGVEVTHSRVRRERMGHIDLAVPVLHIWYFKSRKISKLLNITNLKLERVIYYESYIVIKSDHPDLEIGLILTDEEYREAKKEYGDVFKVGMGAEAIRVMLADLDLEEMATELRTSIANETTYSRRKKNIKRLKEVEAFRLSSEDNRPEWMILQILPVLPPDLRPLVPLDGGRFASSDLNDLYRRVINRNNRLKRLLDLQAPDVILRNEKRMLQEAVDAVLDNSSRRKPVKGAGMRPLRSLSDLLKGKRGRFRQNLLGKRVDYSGRSVIVVGPDLKMHQCGLPKTMALELFKPFVVARICELLDESVKKATKRWEEADEIVWPVLEEVIQNHPVLLNRAPTLHRLGIQAFEPVLVEGKAIQLHPLACSAFNADFDGDQMAVHVPISAEAQVEARMLMLGSKNILRPASGEPVATPSHDMVIGIYYLTKPLPGAKGEGMIFASTEEVRGAYDAGKIDLHAKIKIKGVNKIVEENGDKVRITPPFWKDYTTVGQVIFNEIVPEELGYIMSNARIPHEKIFSKKGLNQLVGRCFNEQGSVRTAVFLDNLKELGFHYSTVAGLTVGICDMLIPASKKDIIEKTVHEIELIEKSSRRGELTEAERYNRVIDNWAKTTEEVKNAMMEGLRHDNHGFNPVYMMANSGARGSVDQMKQLSGMRGLMAKPRKKLTGELGETIETPIISSLKEGLSVIEYSISTHGSRKGLADTALKTADAGYLTRRLVDVCQDVIIIGEDCGTIRGRVITALKEGEEVIEPLRDRILGRVTAETIYKPGTDDVVCEAGQEITAEFATEIDRIGVESVRIRSVLACEAKRGLCAKCYGWDLSRNRMVTVGEAVGVIAAQSIGEPGTQLTLRTFHTGGVAGRETRESEVTAKHSGYVSLRIPCIVKSTNQNNSKMMISTRNTQLDILDDSGEILSTYDIVVGSQMKTEDGKKIKKNDVICKSDPFIIPIVAEQEGSVHYVDIEEDTTLKEEIDSEQRKQMVIVEDRSKTLHPHIFILPEQMVVLGGHPRRREEELYTLGELEKEMIEGHGRIIYTYQEVSTYRTETIAEDFIERMKDQKIPVVSVNCRKAGTGSYAALIIASREIIKAFGKKAKKEVAALESAIDDLENTSKRKNTELEEKFASALADLSLKGSFIVVIESLDRGHQGTKNLVMCVQDIVTESAMMVISDFTTRGARSHIEQRGRKKIASDPVEEFIADSVRGKYPIPSGAHLRVNDGSLIKSGVHIARIERKLGQQRDITGGLPRVDELFEARIPKDAASIAEIDGIVALSPIKAGIRTVTIRGDHGQESAVKIQASKHIRVREGDRVKAGDRLTEGPLSPHDILRIMGTEAAEKYLLNEIQEVYRLQGVNINDKHISIVVRQMLSKAKIDDPGDTQFLEGSQIDRLVLQRDNKDMMMEGKKPATSAVLLLGVTKASLATDSFLSAASFQETNRVLADAATAGKVDYLHGLKENVIVGHLIPAGTGVKKYQNIRLTLPDGEGLPEPAFPDDMEERDIDETDFDV
ncbi:MAG: DNA-directed RNA polymerase subunit beta' [Candidatus Aegiribacteria sp.]|nr:DNA-directed RNA polymerase subunit beta' [Candidatus Aegiribacteria sp.]